MSRKPKSKPIDPWPSQATPRRHASATPGGLTRQTVEDIYYYVLGVEPADPVSPVKPVDPAKPARPAGGRTPQGRFNKGESGNPRGRPRRSQAMPPIPPAAPEPESLIGITKRYATRKVKAHTENGEVELTLPDAIMGKMASGAVKGNTGHARTFMQLVGRAEAEEIKRQRELFRYWSEQKALAKELYREAEEAGNEPPLSVHPDDIVLNIDGTFAIVGPTSPDAITAMRQTHSRVDYHVVNIAYSQWVERRWIRSHGNRIDGVHYAELAFWDEQDDLPPRLKMSIDELAMRLKTYARFSGRVLHGFLRAKAHPLGLDVPPREAREPMIIPREILEIAKENKIGLRQLLETWPKVDSKLKSALVDEFRTAARVKSDRSR